MRRRANLTLNLTPDAQAKRYPMLSPRAEWLSKNKSLLIFGSCLITPLAALALLTYVPSVDVRNIPLKNTNVLDREKVTTDITRCYLITDRTDQYAKVRISEEVYENVRAGQTYDFTLQKKTHAISNELLSWRGPAAMIISAKEIRGRQYAYHATARL